MYKHVDDDDDDVDEDELSQWLAGTALKPQNPQITIKLKTERAGLFFLDTVSGKYIIKFRLVAN